MLKMYRAGRNRDEVVHLFGSFSVQISNGTPAVMTEGFHDFPQSLRQIVG
jgi:hypothetical protein